MAAGLVDIDGNVHRESSVPTDHSLDSESLYADLVGLVESVLGSDVSYDVCGVGCGGPMSPGGAGSFASQYSGMAQFRPC